MSSLLSLGNAMKSFVDALKSGHWVTLERLRVYAWILVVFWLCGIGAVILTAKGGIDFMGRPLGADFSNVWSAGRLALEGVAAQAYDPRLHALAQQAHWGMTDIPFYGWHYPPFFLLMAAALAVLPYGWALLVWMALTFPLYGAVMGKIAPFPLTTLLAIAYPAVAMNLIQGQNGFVNAALMGAGLLALDRRPVWSGFAFGLLAYKPQFGLLIPLVLAATGRWRVFAVAGGVVFVLIGAVTWAFGTDIWRAFFISTVFTREVVLEAGALRWDKLVSVFAALRLLGASVQVAYMAQGLLVVSVAVVLVWLWRKPVAMALKSAGLVTAALLVTPYALDYDLVILGLGIAWMVAHGLKHGFLAWEKSVLAVAWIMPLVSRLVAIGLHLPLALIVMVLLLGLILRRARWDLSQNSTGS